MGFLLLTSKLADCKHCLKPQLYGGKFHERKEKAGEVILTQVFTQTKSFRGQDDPGQRMARDEEEGQGNGPLFLIKSVTVGPEGNLAYAPCSFTPFTEFSGFDQQLLHARHFLWFPLSLFLITALWGQDVRFPFWRWGNWSGRSTFTASPACVWRQDPTWNASPIWPTLILPALALEWEIIGLHENTGASGNPRKRQGS